MSAWQGLQPGVELHWSCSQQSGLPQGKQYDPLQEDDVLGLMVLIAQPSPASLVTKILSTVRCQNSSHPASCGAFEGVAELSSRIHTPSVHDHDIW